MNIDFKKLLPDPNKIDYDKVETIHPFNILLKYARGFEEIYPGKLAGVVTESGDIIPQSIINYSFYITAAIGQGYSYRLLELEPTTGALYPLNIKVFEKHTRVFGEVNAPDELEAALQTILQSSFSHTLIANLLERVRLYNDSRNDVFHD